jgi:osmotically inducible protein OsmC
MAEAVSSASVVWDGPLAEGEGTVSLESDAAEPMRVTWDARIGGNAGVTTPEELVAAAHATCFSMMLAGLLSENGTPPARLQTGAGVAFSRTREGFKVSRSELSVMATVSGIGEEDFAEIAERAKETCPISVALKGNIEMTLEARLLAEPGAEGIAAA